MGVGGYLAHNHIPVAGTANADLSGVEAAEEDVYMSGIGQHRFADAEVGAAGVWHTGEQEQDATDDEDDGGAVEAEPMERSFRPTK